MSLRGLGVTHLVDRAAGVPALLLLSLVRGRHRLPERPGAVLLIPGPAIGDTLLSGLLVRPLRRRWPAARVLFGAFPANRAAAGLLEEVDAVVSLDTGRPLASARRIRGAGAEVVVDTGPWPRLTALLAALSGAYTVGFRRRGQARHLAFDAWAEHQDGRHEVANLEGLLRCLGLGGPLEALDGVALATEPVPDAPPAGTYAVLHPWASGSGKRLKEWPAERWEAVARWARGRGLSVVLTGGPSDEGDARELAEGLRAAGVAPVQDFTGRLSLAGTGALLRGAALVVAVNTGTMHLAALLGCPVVGLHGPTDPARWGPVGPRVGVAGPPDGGGFLSLGYEFRGAPRDTMARLSAEEVLERAAGLLDAGG
jgi:ADP-heptose:LPS heptosyltransferase